MNFKNLALGYVATAPSPATTGTSLVLGSGEGARFPQPSTDGNFYVTAMPPGENPNVSNSEILQVTARSTDTLTIVREQGDTTAKTIEEGWIILQSIYKENILDENDMASNSDTALATQQSIAAAIGGWLTAGIDGVTVTRASIDDPTVVLTFASTDVTDYIWKGTRIKLTEGGTTHYMIVSLDPVFSTDTTVTCLMEIDTTTPTQAKDPVSTGDITAVAYAPPKTFPSGFPISPLSWTTYTSDSTTKSQDTPTNGTWYNTGLSINLPIGDWEFNNRYLSAVFDPTTSGRSIHRMKSTISTTTNTETINSSTVAYNYILQNSSSGSTSSQVIFSKFYYSVTSKTTLYLLFQRIEENGNLRIYGAYMPSLLKATSTLL
jgi:hypothetical protein